MLFIILPLIFILIPRSSIGDLATRYECPSSSGLVIDDYTGKPIEGATVYVFGSASRPSGNEHNPDVVEICHVTVITDKNGIYTMPAWTNDIGNSWEYYEQKIITKPKPEEKPQTINTSIFKGAVPPHGLVIRTAKWRQDAITRQEILNQESNICANATNNILPDSLIFYTGHNKMVQDGRFIDGFGLSKLLPSFMKGVYTRPKPELIITHIKSFSTSNLDLHYWEPGYKRITVKLFPTDARKLQILKETRVSAVPLINNFVVMLGGKPVSALWTSDTGYLYFPKGQDTHEVEKFLQQLVQHK